MIFFNALISPTSFSRGGFIWSFIPKGIFLIPAYLKAPYAFARQKDIYMKLILEPAIIKDAVFK